MGLLDGDLQAIFGEAFADIYLDGTLHKSDLTVEPVTFKRHPIKCQPDDWSEVYKVQNGIPQTDIRVLVLQHNVTARPNQDDEITVRGKRYRISGPVREDEAQAYWEIQARPKGGT